MFDEIINVTDSLSTNVASNVSINLFNKNVTYKMGCYILHAVLLVIMSLFITSITCSHDEQKNVLL